MADQITETQASAEEVGYPSQNNPKEIVPWLNKAAEKMEYYESKVKRIKKDSAYIQSTRKETSIFRLIRTLVVLIPCDAICSAICVFIAFVVLGLVQKFLIPNRFLFDFVINNWFEIGCVLCVILYLLTVYRAISERNKKNQSIREAQSDLDECARILNSDECISFYSYILPFMGPSYRYSFAANYFAKLFLDGRCSNLQDCKNLYEQDKHAIEQRQQFLTLLAEVGEAKSIAREALSRSNTALAASSFATATALSAGSRASAAESSLEDIRRSL